MPKQDKAEETNVDAQQQQLLQEQQQHQQQQHQQQQHQQEQMAYEAQAAALMYQQQQQQQQQMGGQNQLQLQMIHQFWANQIHQLENDPIDFKLHMLPLARIKKVMKTDDDVRTRMMISAEAPVVFAKACEIFILELALRSWIQTEESRRRTLQRSDIAAAIAKTDMYDFLIDIVPRDEGTRVPTSKKLDNLPGANYDQYYQHLMAQYPALAEANVLAYQQSLQQQQEQQQQQEDGAGQGEGSASGL